jgi:hypothetical protein
MTKLTHIGASGDARMVEVSEKAATERAAIAEGRVVMRPETLALVRSGDAKKGDVLGTARIAGIMAAKRTHELIPLCHPIALTQGHGRPRARRGAARRRRTRRGQDRRAYRGRDGGVDRRRRRLPHRLRALGRTA